MDERRIVQPKNEHQVSCVLRGGKRARCTGSDTNELQQQFQLPGNWLRVVDAVVSGIGRDRLIMNTPIFVCSWGITRVACKVLSGARPSRGSDCAHDVVDFEVIIRHGRRLSDQLETLNVGVEFVLGASDIVHFHTFAFVVENVVLWHIGNLCDWEIHEKWLLRSISWQGCKVIERSDNPLSIDP